MFSSINLTSRNIVEDDLLAYQFNCLWKICMSSAHTRSKKDAIGIELKLKEKNK